MPTDYSQIMTFLSFLIAAVALFRNLKGDTKSEAGTLTEIIVKLETINENIKEVKNDNKEMRLDINDIKERLTIVEQSVKSAHKRIDEIHDEHEAE